jgi:AcrR family transcriptional regulator
VAPSTVEDVEPGSASWWEAHTERLRRRRPRAGGLTVERIVDEAIDLMDAEGLDALTVRTLTARLGTSSATLYRHVASVEELLVLVIDRVLGDIELPRPERSGRERTIDLAVAFRRVLLEHPGVVPALRAAPLLGPNAMRSATNGMTNLVAAGYPPAVAVQGYLAIVDYILGSAFFDTAGVAERRDDRAGSPAPSVFEAHRAALDGVASEDVFRFAIVAFLDGLDAASSR